MGALNGLKILDFSEMLPGPMATMLLSDMGAEVLRVNSPAKVNPKWKTAEDLSPTESLLNRNKKQITLDLKKPEAIKIIHELVQEYDIVLEQFRPGVMDRLGIGYEALSKSNPKVIYCALTGFGQNGPDAMRAGHDINYIARSSILSYSGRIGDLPPILGIQMADQMSGSVNTMLGILMAVIQRMQTGEGQFVDVSMVDGLVAMSCAQLINYIMEVEKNKDYPIPSPENSPMTGASYYDCYRTKDDRFMSVGSLEPKFFMALCNATGHPEFADGSCRPTGAQMRKGFTEAFAQKTQAEWIAIFSTIDACVEPVMNVAEVVSDPQVIARGMLPEVPVPGTSRTVKQPGNPIQLSKSPAAYRHTGYPSFFHTHETLVSLGYNEKAIEELYKSGTVL